MSLDLCNAYVDAVNSAGSAMQEQSRWMESLEAKIQKFKAAFESLSNTIIDSDFLKFLVDSGTTVINVLDTIISNVGVLGTALAGFGGYKFIKNFDQPKIQGCPSLTDILGWVYHGGEYIIMAI